MASKCAADLRCCRSGLWRRRERGEGEGRWGRGKVQARGRVEAGGVKVRLGRGSAGRAGDGGRQEGEEQGGGRRGWLRQR